MVQRPRTRDLHGNIWNNEIERPFVGILCERPRPARSEWLHDLSYKSNSSPRQAASYQEQAAEHLEAGGMS